MRIFAPSRIAFIFLFLPFFTNTLEAGDNVVSKEFITEPPTLISLGFEWQIDGDDNRNAEVAVSYRKIGDKDWIQGLPLLRLQREPTISGPIAYTAPNMFAGSIFDLQPDTEYECRFVMTDRDGVAGKTEHLVNVRTRPDFTAKREERKFKTLQAFTEATGQDRPSILIDHDVFQKVMAPDPADPRKLYTPNDFDFRLRPASAAVDAGVLLPNINDDFTGREEVEYVNGPATSRLGRLRAANGHPAPYGAGNRQ
jgi:hypothetical protein